MDVLALALDHGRYSSEPRAREHIRTICAEGRGWAGEDGYLVAAVLVTRNPALPGDRTPQLLTALQVA